MTADDDRPQVDRHRLVQRQQLEAAAVDLDVQLVDRTVAGEHAVDDSGASRSTRPLDRRADAVLGQPAHLEQARLELFQLFLKVRNDTVGHDFNSYGYQLSAIGCLEFALFPLVSSFSAAS